MPRPAMLVFGSFAAVGLALSVGGGATMVAAFDPVRHSPSTGPDRAATRILAEVPNLPVFDVQAQPSGPVHGSWEALFSAWGGR